MIEYWATSLRNRRCGAVRGRTCGAIPCSRSQPYSDDWFISPRSAIPATGHYYHQGLAQSLGTEDADRSLCNCHHQVFQQWLGFSLEEQKSDLDEYLRFGSAPRYALPYRKLVPATAREVERQLYLTDLETLLELLKFERGGAFAIPEA